MMQTHLEHILPDFSPHSVCWLQRSDLILTHAWGDGMIAGAYYLIPLLLFYITRRYKFDIRLKFVFYVYGIFIFLCGTTHLMDVVMIWKINNFLITFDGWLRVVTGIFSIFSAIVTLWAAKKFLSLFNDFVELFRRMSKERREQKRATDETWNEFHGAMATLENAFQRGK